jgi:hypothetical protein
MLNADALARILVAKLAPAWRDKPRCGANLATWPIQSELALGVRRPSFHGRHACPETVQAWHTC